MELLEVVGWLLEVWGKTSVRMSRMKDSIVLIQLSSETKVSQALKAISDKLSRSPFLRD